MDDPKKFRDKKREEEPDHPFTKALDRMFPFDKEMKIDELLDILGTTIKYDKINKLITFLCMLNTYTEESQFNVSYRAPSSTGKSYIPIELANYFPKEDVIKIAYSSPTSFYHDTGIWDEESEQYKIDLSRKILIFLDQPHDQLLQRLRPLLSHDEKELLCKITDRKEKKGLRTKNVIIKGFPSTIFCTGSLKIDEQEATRNFILSPELNQKKIREAIYLKALKKGNPLNFYQIIGTDEKRQKLKERIEAIKTQKIKNILIENSEDLVAERFVKKYGKLKPRHARDVERVISLIQGLALFNLWHRKKDEKDNLYASKEDIEKAFELFDQIAETQELGIPPYIFNLYKEVIKPLVEENDGITRKQILAKHYEVYGRNIADWFLRQQILPALETAGLITQEQDPSDKRKVLVYSGTTTPQTSSQYSEYSESECGVEDLGGWNV